MARHLIKGQAAMERSVNEQGRWTEYKEDWDALADEGLDQNEIARRLLDDAKWSPVEIVDMEHEDEVLELDNLVQAQVTCSLVEMYMWVARNIGNNRAVPTDAPDPAAWNLLTHVRGENTIAAGEFWKTMLPRLLPSSREMENQARYSDDGSKQIELAKRILARMAGNAA